MYRCVEIESSQRVILLFQGSQLPDPPGFMSIHGLQRLVTMSIVDVGVKVRGSTPSSKYLSHLDTRVDGFGVQARIWLVDDNGRSNNQRPCENRPFAMARKMKEEKKKPHTLADCRPDQGTPCWLPGHPSRL